MTTGLLYDPRYLDHLAGPDHPESPQRLVSVYSRLQTLPWIGNLVSLKPRVGEDHWIETVHSGEYLRRAEESCKRGETHLDTPDVGICEKSADIARLAVGGALELADSVVRKKTDNGFALLRPPGHHAEEKLAMGFCLFNNIAILARYLQKEHGLNKILILDWDVHHGNGTQHTFEEDPSVLYISLHQYPFYPGTGSARESGLHRGQGATLNCPMAAGSGDWDYQEAFTQKVLPKIDQFRPEFILISAGFDAHLADPLANICLTTNFFSWMSERMMEAAAKHCNGRLISLLEGGYNLKILPECVEAHLKVLAGINVSSK